MRKWEHWTECDRQELTHEAEHASDFKGLLKIAIRIITRMPRKEGACVAQVCGPISSGGYGSVEKNLAMMDKVIRSFADKGFCVFNQIPFERPMQQIKSRLHEQNPDKNVGLQLLEEFYLPLFEQRHVTQLIFMWHYHTSMGACWEHVQGSRLGLSIIHTGPLMEKPPT